MDVRMDETGMKARYGYVGQKRVMTTPKTEGTFDVLVPLGAS